MRIFGLSIPELIIIIAIICVLFGPMLFKKINKQVKDTSKAAKKGIENGAKAAGADVDLNNIDKDSILDKVAGFQDHVDKMFNDDDEDTKEPAQENASSQETAGNNSEAADTKKASKEEISA